MGPCKVERIILKANYYKAILTIPSKMIEKKENLESLVVQTVHSELSIEKELISNLDEAMKREKTMARITGFFKYAFGTVGVFSIYFGAKGIAEENYWLTAAESVLLVFSAMRSYQNHKYCKRSFKEIADLESEKKNLEERYMEAKLKWQNK